MARGRAATYDDQRGLILRRASGLFAQHGYAATSMNAVAEACGVSKPTIYHYFRDKDALLASICDEHVLRLHAMAHEVLGLPLPPRDRLRELILRILEEYADAQDAHRVLTEDVRFLGLADQARILGREREVVAVFARVVGQIRPDLQTAALAKPLTMLLFGMINWLFTWLRPNGTLDHAAMAPVVADLFLGGLETVAVPPAAAAPAPAPRTHRETPTP
ncbi:MAG: TetR/AcrR family transcriptional regulator [Rubrivivax sp.]